MSERSILIEDKDTNGTVVRDLGFVLISSAYIVEEGKVLLVHHNGFDKWVPPGGHVESGDTFAGTAKREAKEETGADVEIISSRPDINPGDTVAATEPVPFHVDVERAFKPRPAIVQFYWARRTEIGAELTAEIEEVYDIGWFSKEELETLPTFDQVRTLAAYAISNHPDSHSIGHEA